MASMFISCSSLIELDLSSFNISLVKTMSSMFKECTKLEYINLNNSIEKSDVTLTSIFLSIPINIVICIDINNNKNINTSISKIQCPTIDCSNEWKKHQKKIIIENNQKNCYNFCYETINYKYEYENICVEECPNGTYPNNKSFKCDSEKISFESDYIFGNEEMTSNIHLLYSDSTIINNNINDTLINDSNYIYTNIKDEKNYMITNIETYLTSHYYLNTDIQKNKDFTDNKISNIILKKETDKSLDNNSATDIITYNKINFETYLDHISNSIKGFTTNEFDNSNKLFYDNSYLFTIENNTKLFTYIKNYVKEYSISDNKNIIIKGESDFIYQITTTDNEKELINKNISEEDYNISMIDFSECEQHLKQEYNINENLTLIILKKEKMTNITSEKNIQYQIYEPINITLLNTSICNNILIKIFIPFSLRGEILNLYEDLKDNGYNLFDKNDKFYNDICTPFSSLTGTDIPLSARQKYIFSEYGNLCQENCQFTNYSINTKLITCNCEINNELIEPDNENKFNPKILYKSFYDILKYSNYKVLVCSNLVFKKQTLLSNKGSIIAIIYFLLYISFLILFIIKGISPLKIICSKFEGNSPINDNEMNLRDNKRKSINSININEINNIMKKSDGKKKVIRIIKKVKRKKSTIDNNNPRVKRLKKNNLDNNKNKSRNTNNQSIINNSNKNKKLYSTSRNVLDIKKNNNEKDISVYVPKINDVIEKNDNEELSDYELNNLEYEDILKLGHRKFYQIYWSILKREHLILFTFFSFDDYNLLSIKFARFIFLVCSDMALNIFFFSDDTMNKIFLTYGKYDFIQKIPQFIYTVIVSQLLEVLLCFLSLTDKYVYKIKRSKNKSFDTVKKIYKIIKIKLCFFCVITFILFIFYWYIITTFCAVYKNTQIIFIKDSIISFITGLIYPFILYLFPSSLKIICLKNKDNNLKLLYFLSDIIPIF